RAIPRRSSDSSEMPSASASRTVASDVATQATRRPACALSTSASTNHRAVVPVPSPTRIPSSTSAAAASPAARFPVSASTREAYWTRVQIDPVSSGCALRTARLSGREATPQLSESAGVRCGGADRLPHVPLLDRKHRFDHLRRADARTKRNAAALQCHEHARGDLPAAQVDLLELCQEPVELAQRVAPTDAVAVGLWGPGKLVEDAVPDEGGHVVPRSDRSGSGVG